MLKGKCGLKLEKSLEGGKSKTNSTPTFLPSAESNKFF
jgi:hypothetical protein